MIIQICVGSSCHLRGSADIVDMMKEAVREHHLEADVTLAGIFCTEKCNRVGVTVQIDDDVYTGITAENFNTFFSENVLSKL